MAQRNKKIVIITEFGFDIGLGHLIRSINLYNALVDGTNHSVDIYSFNKDNLDISLPPFLKNTDEDFFKEKFDILILDFSSYSIERLKDFTYTTDVIMIGFGVPKEYFSFFTYVINVSEGTGITNKKYMVGNTRVYEGSKYIFLKRDLLQWRNKHSLTNPKHTVFIMFGGTDPKGLTLSLTRLFISYFQTDSLYSKRLKLIIRLAQSHPYFAQIEEMSKTNNQITLISSFVNTVEMFQKADLIITSPGNIFFEAAYYGIPTVLLTQNSKQASDFNGFPNIYSIEDFNDIESILSEVYCNYKKWQELYQIMSVAEGEAELLNELFC
jgi:spore coat polysaccharide biosynthesis predicted glycosyltransferase SpsG